MKPLNILTIQGRLGREPESRYTKTGNEVINTSLAISNGKDKKADFVELVAYDDKVISDFKKYFHKGYEIIVHGSLHVNEWTDKNGSVHKNPEIKVDNLSFVSAGKSGRNDEPSDADDTDLKYVPAPEPEPLDSSDGELPF